MLLDDSDIEAFFKMTNENVRFCSPFSLHKNTTTGGFVLESWFFVLVKLSD